MKIYINQIPPDGLSLAETISPAALDIDTELIHVQSPIDIKAELNRGANFVSALLSVHGQVKSVCSRCLSEFSTGFAKEIRLDIPIGKTDNVIDLTEDIREGILLDYPMKPLCKEACLGLCPKCGVNLNEKTCDCKKE